MKTPQHLLHSTLMALALICLPVAISNSATLTVTSTADSGAGTLRQAILDANADASPDDVNIEFNIPGSGVQTIAPLSPLPIITRTVNIDGYTQPGASPNTLANANNAVLRIELNGENHNVGSGFDIGFFIQADNCSIRGLVINRFKSAGILVRSSDNVVLEGNFVGTDAVGTIALANLNGIGFEGGTGNRVGGLTPAARNLVGGNLIGIYVVATEPNEILGNFIGIGPDGAAVIQNQYGIYLNNCARTQIGGNTPGARNVISGNGAGIWVQAVGGNSIQGNYIGTDVSGTLARGNSTGIEVSYSTNNLVGGTGAGAGNLISGNLGQGVSIDNNATAGNNAVQGNLIGTDVTGTQALGNADYGVLFQGSGGNIVGGTNAGARNVISASHTGVGLYGLASTNNAVLGNSIFGNTSIGIDLGTFSPADLGPTLNDAGDADESANHYQNYPEITSVERTGRNLKMAYRVDSAAVNSAYPLTMEFFIADAAGQGRTFIHRAIYSAPQTLETITFKPATLPGTGEQLVATATDANGNTSEFSPAVPANLTGRKVNVCHNGMTISIDESAVPAHLNHGDSLGACP